MMQSKNTKNKTINGPKGSKTTKEKGQPGLEDFLKKRDFTGLLNYIYKYKYKYNII